MESRPMPLSENEKTLISLVAHGLFGRAARLSAAPDWDGIMREARLQSVFQTAFDGLDELLPAELRESVKKQCFSNTCNSARVFSDHSFVHGELSENGIDYVILKGCASAAYYNEPLKRAMGDVDFLVDRADLEKTGALLEKSGYSPWQENHAVHVVYRNGLSHLELHFAPPGVPEGKAGEVIKGYMKELLPSARKTQIAGVEMIVPAHFHHGLILLMHTVHHLLSEGVGLRHLCDWAVFVNSFSDAELRDLFEARLRTAGLWRTFQLLSLVCVRYLGIDSRPCFGSAEDSILDAVMEDVIRGGNFGAKDAGRSREGLFISQRGKDGVGRSRPLMQFIRNLNRIIITRWPAAERHRVLIFFGWIYYGARYLIRSLLGRHDLAALQRSAESAKGRKSIYKHFRLYEQE